MSRRTLKNLAAAPLRTVPYSFGKLAFRLWLSALAARKPSFALRLLLQPSDDPAGQLDGTAIRYGDGVHVKHRLMRYHDLFAERLQPGERVLDIGCGCGAVAYSMASRANVAVVGIDLNAESIAGARRRFQHPQLHFVHGDALVDLPQRLFDVVVISNVLEHIEDRSRFLRNTQATVRARRWLIRVPMLHRHWTVPLRQELAMFAYSDPTHYTEYTPRSLQEEMERSGLAISHFECRWGEIWAEAYPCGDNSVDRG